MKNVLFLFCAAVSWFAAIYKVRDIRASAIPLQQGTGRRPAFLGAGLATSTPAGLRHPSTRHSACDLMRPANVRHRVRRVRRLMLTYGPENVPRRKRAILVVAFYAVLFVTMGVFYAASAPMSRRPHWSSATPRLPGLRST